MQIQLITRDVLDSKGYAVMQLVEALGRSQVRFPMVQLEFFIDNPSVRTMVLGWTQSITEMSTNNIAWG